MNKETMNNWDKRPKYWEDVAWFKERNKELAKDKKGGMSIAKLCGKYDITPKRIYDIIKSLERKQDAQ